MKSYLAVPSVVFSAAVLLASTSGMRAQSPAPTATVAPAKPEIEAASPTASPAAAPAAAKTEKEAAPQKPQRSAEEKAARKAERLRKYDTNKDGKLDEKERAAMRADQAKAAPTP